jgi:hypothetical protein
LENFVKLKANIDIYLTSKKENETQTTLSFKRMILAVKFFNKAFDGAILNKDKIDKYINILFNAHISTHITEGKEVAVQVFELHNTRGIRLNIIEIVKAKLMKAVFQHSSEEKEAERIIQDLQKTFGKIYELEELTAENTFRGELGLDDILFHHLRIIDDGSVIDYNHGDSEYDEPSMYTKREDAIVEYIEKRIKNQKSSRDKVNYVINLTERFYKSVLVSCEWLPLLDKENNLAGDVLIFERELSLEFF